MDAFGGMLQVYHRQTNKRCSRLRLCTAAAGGGVAVGLEGSGTRT